MSGCKMKIGFYTKWNKHSLKSTGNVIGDELVGESLCRALIKSSEVASAELYAPNCLPRDLLDVMIYLNDTEPNEKYGHKNMFYIFRMATGMRGQKLSKDFGRLVMMAIYFFPNACSQCINLQDTTGFFSLLVLTLLSFIHVNMMSYMRLI